VTANKHIYKLDKNAESVKLIPQGNRI